MSELEYQSKWWLSQFLPMMSVWLSHSGLSISNSTSAFIQHGQDVLPGDSSAATHFSLVNWYMFTPQRISSRRDQNPRKVSKQLRLQIIMNMQNPQLNGQWKQGLRSFYPLDAIPPANSEILFRSWRHLMTIFSQNLAKISVSKFCQHSTIGFIAMTSRARPSTLSSPS